MARCFKCKKIIKDNLEECPYCGTSTQWEVYFSEKEKGKEKAIVGLKGWLIPLLIYLVIKQAGWILGYAHMNDQATAASIVIVLSTSCALGAIFMFFLRNRYFKLAVCASEILLMIYYIIYALMALIMGAMELIPAITFVAASWCVSIPVIVYVLRSKRVANTFVKG